MTAGVIFFRAATKAAATWRVAAVLELGFVVVFVATVGAVSAAFFFVGISVFREVSTAALVAAAVLDLVVRVSAFGGAVFTARVFAASAAFVVGFDATLPLDDLIAAEGLPADVLGIAEVLAEADLATAARVAGALPADVARLPDADFAVAAVLFGAADGFRPAVSFEAAACFETACFGAACFGLAARASAFIRGTDSGFAARAGDFTLAWGRDGTLRPPAVAGSLAADIVSLAFRLREVATAFAFGGIGRTLPIGRSPDRSGGDRSAGITCWTPAADIA